MMPVVFSYVAAPTLVAVHAILMTGRLSKN